MKPTDLYENLKNINHIVFSAGEIHLTSPPVSLQLRADIHSSETLMKLFGVLHTGIPKILHLPYLPYGRADRHMPKAGGEVVGVKLLGDILNQFNLEKIYTLDAHSPASSLVVKNLVNIPPYALIHRATQNIAGAYLVSPDAGAEKKIYTYSKEFSLPVLRAYKTRDTLTGDITGIQFIDTPPKHAIFVVVDDICDGGRTFIELAKSGGFKPQNSILCVSHGIFSKGLNELNNYYGEIFTSDSFPQTKTTTITYEECYEFVTGNRLL